VGAVKIAKYYGFGPNDVIITVATDGAIMYDSERALAVSKYFPNGLDNIGLAEIFAEHVLGATTDNLLELTQDARERIFNLGYFTWVEQQGVSVREFEARREQSFWAAQRDRARDLDELIREFNLRAAAV
jgi:hypothetical protein